MTIRGLYKIVCVHIGWWSSPVRGLCAVGVRLNQAAQPAIMSVFQQHERRPERLRPGMSLATTRRADHG